jgi:hypothetical protein
MTDEKPKRGRPPAPDPGARVSTWLRQADYDKLLKAAKARDVTVSALMRSLVTLRTK